MQSIQSGQDDGVGGSAAALQAAGHRNLTFGSDGCPIIISQPLQDHSHANLYQPGVHARNVALYGSGAVQIHPGVGREAYAEGRALPVGHGIEYGGRSARPAISYHDCSISSIFRSFSSSRTKSISPSRLYLAIILSRYSSSAMEEAKLGW